MEREYWIIKNEIDRRVRVESWWTEEAYCLNMLCDLVGIGELHKLWRQILAEEENLSLSSYSKSYQYEYICVDWLIYSVRISVEFPGQEPCVGYISPKHFLEIAEEYLEAWCGLHDMALEDLPEEQDSCSD